MRVPVPPETFPAIPVPSGLQSVTAGQAGFPAAFGLRAPGRVAVHRDA